MKKGLLFDFNGTMFFDAPKHKEAWDVFSQKYRGYPISNEELEQTHGLTNKRIIALLLGEMSDAESEELSKAKEAMYRTCCINDPKNFHLVEGLEELLDTLTAMKIPMTICSASIKDNIDFFISSFHLYRWFDTENIIYDDGTHANKISMFQDGAATIHVPLKDCMIIEDSLSGIEFANQCHPGTIVAITSPKKKEEYKQLPGVDTVIENYRDFDISFFLK